MLPPPQPGVPLPVAVQGSKHHVSGVQGMDEVGWEGILLLHSVWLPGGGGRERKRQGAAGFPQAQAPAAWGGGAARVPSSKPRFIFLSG